VLHRDLKPGNLMLGDFGEVHVLDWGLAKLKDAPLDESSTASSSIDSQGADPTATMQGALMGTPGYMSPEQVRGETTLDARTDIYALGSILFEILTLHPLHETRNIAKLLHSTATGVDARPSVRFPDADVPPELEAICVRATELEPAKRFASARELADAIERYLDGDRDLQRRRELAASHLATAKSLAERTFAEAGDNDARVQAMREVTRALALDPESTEAVQLLTRLLIEAPREMPPEAERELAQSTARGREYGARVSAARYATWFAFLLMLIAAGVRSYAQSLTATAVTAAAMGYAFWMYRRGRTSESNGIALLVLSSASISLLSPILGPFVIVPGLVATNTVFFALHANRRGRQFIGLVGVLAMLVPAALELLHIVPPSYAFANGSVTILPRMTDLAPHQTMLVMLVTSIALVITPAFVAGRMHDALAEAERRLFLHAWQLRQLVPEQARPAVAIGAR
jgi:serine/threonine-protein kinase